MRSRRSDVCGFGVAGVELARVEPDDGAAWGAQRHRLEGAGGGAVVVAAAGRAPRALETVAAAARMLAADRLVLAAAAAAQRPRVRHQDAAERLAELGVENRVDHRVERAVRVAQPRQNLLSKNWNSSYL